MTAAGDWVLALSWDERGRARLDGVSTIRRGDLEVFATGVIYDRADWIRELQLTPAATSAELTISALERNGPGVVTRLRGSFVLAALDHGTATIAVHRDPLGSHPLFFTTGVERILFAASPLPLLDQPGVSRELNRAALADHLCKRWPDRQETFFSAIRRVPPGWVVRGSRVGVTSSRYWDPIGDRIEWLSDAESDQFDAILDRAVDRGFENGPTGIFLSGGFDSVSVAAVAADRARASGASVPLALSLGFPDPDCDEQHVQASVARALQLPLHLVRFREALGPRGLLAPALDLNRGLAAPLFNTWTPAYEPLVRHAAGTGVRAILTGEGGDEWLGVTPYLAADLLRQFRFAEMAQLALTTKRSYQLGWLAVLRGTLWRHGVRPVAGLWASRIAPVQWDQNRAARVQAAIPSWIGADPEMRREQFQRALQSLTPADPPGGFYSRECRMFLDHPLTSWIFEEQHQLGGRLGVRYVHPYWDPDVLMLAYRTRPDRLNKGGISKGLVRQTIARRFPALGFERQPKVAAVRFFADLVRAELPPLASAHDDFAALASLGVVDPKRARAFVSNVWAGTPHDLGRAWNLVNLESWTRRQLH